MTSSGGTRGAKALILVAWAALAAAAVWCAAAPAAPSSSPSAGPSSPPASASPSPSGVVAPDMGAPGGAQFSSLCATCHGRDGGGGTIGPSLRAAAFPTMVAEKVREGGGGMPAFGRLPAAQIETVSYFVATQLTDPSARTAPAGEGGDLYRLYCSCCHSTTGRGGAMTTGRNAPSFRGKPAANAWAAMLRGPGNMPVFDQTLDVRGQAAVGRYVSVLVRPPSPGGNGLGYVGPVSEGFVALALLVVLVLVATWLARGKGGAARG